MGARVWVARARGMPAASPACGSRYEACCAAEENAFTTVAGGVTGTADEPAADS
jgi:hypothetical protein